VCVDSVTNAFADRRWTHWPPEWPLQMFT